MGTEGLHELLAAVGAGRHVLDFFLGLVEESGVLVDDGFDLSVFGPGIRPMVEVLEEVLELLCCGAIVGVVPVPGP